MDERTPDYEDPIDLLEKIVQTLSDKQCYKNITSPHELAATIIEHCSGNVMDTSMISKTSYNKFDFLELFYRSIRKVVCHY